MFLILIHFIQLHMHSTLIASNHTLPITNIEELASTLANVFNTTVDYGYWDNGTIQDFGYQSMNRIVNTETDLYAELIDNKLMNNGNCEYIFEIGEVAIKIYKEILSFDYPFDLDINTLNQDQWKEKDYLVHLHLDLKNLGALQVLYADDSLMQASTILTQKEQTWNEFKSNIQQKIPNFVVQL